MWERGGQMVEVAVFVRTLALAERPKAPVASRTLLRQQMESLGITFPAMLRLRWLIDAETPAQAAPRLVPMADIRSRLGETG